MLIETCLDRQINRLIDLVARACQSLGHSVDRWYRHKTALIPACDVIFWWGNNQSKEIQERSVASGARIIYMELGWTLDRDSCLQMDTQGTGPLVSWANDPLVWSREESLRVKSDGDLLVVLGYEGFDIKSRPLTSPYFACNLEWMQHLQQASRMRFRLRPHPRTRPDRLADLKSYAEEQGLLWDTEGTIKEALDASRAVAVLDSVCAIQALELSLPVLLYGQQVCHHPGVVFCMNDSLELTAGVTQKIAGSRELNDLNVGAIKALLYRVWEKQWYSHKVDEWPGRLRREFGL